jgi:anaerobic selenocysteine-containing dehydrogenase
MADYVLPNHIYLERYEDVPNVSGFPQPIIGMTRPVVEPQLDTRHTGEVIIQIAQSMGGVVGAAFAWDDYETCLEETLGDKWETMVEQGYWLDAEFKPPAWSAAFETDSGRFEFVNSAMRSFARYAPIKPEGDDTEFPLVLIPYDYMRLAWGEFAAAPYMVKAVEDTVLKGNDVRIEINPETAALFGLKNGRKARLTTPRGSVTVGIYLYDGIRPGVIALARGLGHTAYDRFIAGKGVNYNQVVGPLEDPASGHDAAWGIRAKLTKV